MTAYLRTVNGLAQLAGIVDAKPPRNLGQLSVQSLRLSALGAVELSDVQ